MGNLLGRKRNKPIYVPELVDIPGVEDGGRNWPEHQPDKLAEYRKIIEDSRVKNLQQMREDLKKDPKIFVLNNLILAVQCYENFERDEEIIKSRKNERETAANEALSDPRKKCVYHGARIEVLGDRLRYKAPNTQKAEIFPSIRYTIVHENIEVYREDMFPVLSNKVYTAIDENIYRVCMEDLSQDNMPGFVRLMAVDIPRSAGYRDEPNPSMYDKIDESDGYSKLSDDEHSKVPSSDRSSSRSNSDPSTKEEASGTPQVPPEIANRPPMKTPDHSDSSDGEQSITDWKNNIQSSDKLVERINNSRLPMPRTHELIRRAVSANPIAEMSEESDSNTQPSGRRDSGVLPANLLMAASRSKPRSAPTKLPPGPIKTSRSEPNLSDYSSSEDYDYAVLNAPRKLKPPPKDRPRIASIPHECFVDGRRKIRITDGSDPLGIGSKLVHQTYLSSRAFFDYFGKYFYDFGERLSPNGLSEVTTVKSVIRCRENREFPPADHLAILEFNPVLRVPEWPQIASEWKNRKRDIIRDPRTNIAYSWPTESQVSAVTNQGCFLQTQGDRIRGRLLQQTLHWQMNFSNAEEYLLSSLSHCHLRCLTWIQLIFHHTLAPMQVLTSDHVTSLFLRMVERNYIDWDESVLGARLLRFFRNLYHCLKRRRLSHYFIHQRNLFHSKTPGDMNRAQEKVHRLLESFLANAIQAASQLQHYNSSYPFPDLVELWNILTSESVLTALNPQLMAGSRQTLSESETDKKRSKKASATTDETFFERQTKRTKDRTRELSKLERARREAEEREKNGPKPVKTTQLINTGTQIRPMDPLRLKLLLTYFINHFIETARIANLHRAYEMSIVVLNQATNLSWLLRDAGFYEDCDRHLETINNLFQVARPGQFREALVTIPGSPCVFQTGVTIPNSDRLERRQFQAVPPVPSDPVTKLANGHVPYKANGDVSKPTRVNDGPAQIPANFSQQMKVEAVVENYSASSDESSEPYRFNLRDSQAGWSDDESTDF